MLGLPWFDLIVAPLCARNEEGTRERLLRTAGRLVRDEGPQALTLAAVARLAAVSPGTLRYHFGGKRGLVEALVREQRAHLAAMRAEMAWKREDAPLRRPRRPTRSRALPASRAAGARRRSAGRWVLPSPTTA